MAHEGTGRIGWAGWLWRGVIVFALVLALARSVASLSAAVSGTSVNAEDALGYASVPRAGWAWSSSTRGPTWIPVAAVEPRGPAAAAGIGPGDEIRFDRLFGQLVAWRVGEPVGLEIVHAGRRFHATAVARKPDRGAAAGRVMPMVNAFAALLFELFALFVLAKGWRHHTAALLAAIFVSLYTPEYLPALPPFLTTPLVLFSVPVASGIGGLWATFALEISGGPSSPRMARRFYAGVAAVVLLDFAVLFDSYLGLTGPSLGSNSRYLALIASNVLAYGALLYNFGRGDAATRNRIKIVSLTFVFLVAGSVSAFIATSMLATGVISAGALAFAAGLPVGGSIAIALFTYAVLRHRLFDFGFAVNRTLVYGAVSFVLLAAFGLAEWGSERLLPTSWHQGSMLVSAGVAVALFLSFHRLRDWIEHYVSRLFFARWQQAEAELKRFVASAGHFEQAPALCRGFAAALAKFAGAEAAVYLRGSDGTYRLQCGGFGGAPATFADDDPAFALMRAEREPLDLTRLDAALPGALALPMLDVGTLTGFVLLGPKPDGAHYRPDEVENLGWAAHQVGLDLQALHARELEAENAALREKLAWLSAPKPRRTKAPALKAVPGGAAS